MSRKRFSWIDYKTHGCIAKKSKQSGLLLNVDWLIRISHLSYETTHFSAILRKDCRTDISLSKIISSSSMSLCNQKDVIANKAGK